MARDDLDRFKSLFRARAFFDAVPTAWERAQADGASGEDAVRTLLAAMNTHGRPPGEEEIRRFFASLRTQPVQRRFLAGLATMFAVWRWHRTSPIAGVGILVGLEAAAGADSEQGRTPALRLHIFEMALDVTEAMPVGTARTDATRLFRNQLGSSLAPDEDPVRAARGRHLLRDHMEELRSAVSAAEKNHLGAAEVHRLRHELARSIANVGQSLATWAGRHDCDDKLARLEEALRLVDESLTFPERAADPQGPQGLFHSLRMRSTCRRMLARSIEDPDRVAALLDGSVADALALRDLVRCSPPGTFREGEAIVVNLINALTDRLEHSLAARTVDAITAAQQLGEIEALARELPRPVHPDVDHLLKQVEGTVGRLRERVTGNAGKADSERIRRHLAAVIGGLSDSRGVGIGSEAARGIIQELELWPEGQQLPGETMAMLGGLFGNLLVNVVGPKLARRAREVEARLLSRETGEVRGLFDPVRYVEDGIKGYHLRLCDWSLGDLERRAIAGWVSALAGAGLAWAETGCRPLERLEELRLADVGGSTAWRSDLTFYGAGPVRDVQTHLCEEGWRCALYRTRWEMDRAAEMLQRSELREMIVDLGGTVVPDIPEADWTSAVFPPGTDPELILAETGVPSSEWVSTPDGIAVPIKDTPERARAGYPRLVEEMRDRWGAGFERGWAPLEIPDLPEPTTANMRHWLSQNHDAAVLCVGAALTPFVLGIDESGEWTERVGPGAELGRLIDEYAAARDDHSFGIAEQDLGLSLSVEERTRRYHARIATPEATARLEQAITGLLAALGGSFAPALIRAKARGVRSLLVLARGPSRQIPWLAIPVGNETLGDAFNIAMVETLAPVRRDHPRAGPSALYVGGGCGEGSSLSLGKAVLELQSERTVGPLPRLGFEALASEATVLRLFAHGTSMLMHNSASGIELDEDDQRPVNRFAASEVRMLDLRGMRRLELWACESGRTDMMMEAFLGHDEPTGVDAEALRAGAECTIASLWTQYVLSTAMIAEAFALELAAGRQGEGEALGAAVRRYRAGLAAEGAFTLGVAAHIEQHPWPLHLDSVLRAGLDAWRSELWTQTLARAAPPLPPNLPIAGVRLGPSSRQKITGENASSIVAQVLAPYRSPVAWAGWKVTVRSKEVLKPWRESQT